MQPQGPATFRTPQPPIGGPPPVGHPLWRQKLIWWGILARRSAKRKNINKSILP